MRTPGRRSELECFVLGLVWQLGPCSAYDVRRHMQRSPSTQWSGSAGAIYPLVERLRRAGLLASRAARTGNRKRLEYSITPKGEDALRAWIGPPLAPEAVTVTYDPLRSRARFLGVMSPAEQRAWVEAARQSLAEVAERVERWRDEYLQDDQDADPFARLVNLHGELDVRWRREWLARFDSVL